MRKRIFGRRLKRDTNERKALFRRLMISLVTYGKIKTTDAKAKSIRAEIEKLVTKAKNKGEAARRLIISRLGNEQAADKIIAEIAPKFATRPGGYTRIIKIGPRIKDAAQMVIIAFVEEISRTSFEKPKRKSLKPKTENVKKIRKSSKTSKTSSQTRSTRSAQSG